MIAVRAKIWICACLLLPGLASMAHAATTLDHAAVTLQLAGQAEPHSPADVELPYSWDSKNNATGGRARFSLDFHAADTASPQALFIPRAGNAFEVSLNGVRIGKMGEPGSDVDFVKQPHFFPIPQGILREKNTLDVTIDAQVGRAAGLSPMVVGAESEVRPAYESNYRLRVIGSLVVAIISSVLGTLALILWFRQREPMYAFYGLSELLWALQVSDVLIQRSPLPWPWGGIVVWSAYAMAPALICKFTLVVIERHHGVLKRLTDWHLILTVPVVMLARLGGWLWLWPAWKAVVVMMCLAVGWTVVRHGMRSSAWDKRILAIAVIATAGTALRDLVFIVILPNTGILPAYVNAYGETSWARYVWVAFGITLAWVIAERMRKSTHAIAHMNRTLSQRLAARELELDAVFALQAQTGRQQAVLEERQRLTRDMHDGLGSQLVGALQLAKNPAVTKEMLAVQLRETLDHLKLTVDAMQDTQGDIASLLGALRYRLNPRLAAAGVQLTWSVEPLPEIAGWTLQKSRDLQMLLFEAFSNLITHAGATHATLRAAPSTQTREIRIALQDNGRGFDIDAMTAAGGHGLANMRARAARIGAELHIESTSKGTQTSLVLPLPDPDLQALVIE